MTIAVFPCFLNSDTIITMRKVQRGFTVLIDLTRGLSEPLEFRKIQGTVWMGEPGDEPRTVFV